MKSQAEERLASWGVRVIESSCRPGPVAKLEQGAKLAHTSSCLTMKNEDGLRPGNSSTASTVDSTGIGALRRLPGSDDEDETEGIERLAERVDVHTMSIDGTLPDGRTDMFTRRCQDKLFPN